MFPELIKTFMANRSLVQKNRCFIIDYWLYFKNNRNNQNDFQQDALEVKQTLQSFCLGDIM